MEEYVEEVLAQGYTEPLTSPASVGFFFIDKKGGGLRPCVDYHGLRRGLMMWISQAEGNLQWRDRGT